MSALLDRLVTAPDAAAEALIELPGLPVSAPTLQADWNAWFRRWIFGDAATALSRTTVRIATVQSFDPPTRPRVRPIRGYGPVAHRRTRRHRRVLDKAPDPWVPRQWLSATVSRNSPPWSLSTE